ncbi:MAG: 1,4-dihydroxy-2-naphthoate octaprenyltransferase [Muribaculaceae bacterium]|nr:1,4-dihydroxy-2-naphthoate octaprenyltransferase [Muribaculaceae bacterium]
MTRAGAWIEAVRLRTLPVSISGVLAAAGYVAASGTDADWKWAPVCLVFAVLAQIASNFANEYFDYRDGIDTAQGRRGPERGVANGIITPRAMLAATLATLGIACLIGLLTLLRGGWEMLPCGIVIALGALGYSAGPYPFSRHCLGEVAVILLYGLAPVVLTVYLLTLTLPAGAWITGAAIGLWGAMVLLVNNYRDIDADRAAGKHTLSTLMGPQGSALLFCALGQLAGLGLWLGGGSSWGALPVIPMALGFMGGFALFRGGLTGAACTRLLAITSCLLFIATFFQTILAL